MYTKTIHTKSTEYHIKMFNTNMMGLQIMNLKINMELRLKLFKF